MVSDSPDPTVIRSIAVTTADVVSALEMRQTSSKRGVLRVTPPFSGRMRARLHVEQPGEYDDVPEPEPLHLHPAELLDDPPSYPRPSETEDELRADPAETYTVERHHDYHASAVAEWREQVPETIRDAITLDTEAGPHEVTLKTLDRNLE